ncbi:MAG: glycosyltransferase family 39 protein [Thermoleophilia bacterium]|nr:glycosyltransferase family 39 protein [Thermoleophilia bacterium]
MALSVIVRILVTLKHQMIQFDETAYVRMAENIAAGNGPLDISGLTTTHYSPLLPLLIAAVAVVLRDYVISGYVVAAVFGTLLLVPTFMLGRDLVGERAGLMAAALMAIAPFFLGTTEYIYSETVYIFFLLMGLHFAWVMLHSHQRLAGAVAGASLGFAYLTNPSGLFYMVAIVALAIVVAWRQHVWRLMAGPAGLFLLCFFILAAPYFWYMHHELGRWTYSGKFIAGNTYSATHGISRDDIKTWEKELMPLNEAGTEVKVLELEQDTTLNNPVNFVLSQPKHAAVNFFKQVYEFHAKVLQEIYPLWLLPLLGLGLFARGWDRKRAVALGYLAVMTLPALLVLSMLAFPRFFMPFIPFAMILTAEGWLRLEEWTGGTVAGTINGKRTETWARLVPWAVGVAVLAPVLAFAGLTVMKQGYATEYKEAGLWLKDNGGAGSEILTRDFSSAYYAGGTAVALPYDTYDRTNGYARIKGVDYMIISRKAIVDWRPGLKPLLQDESSHPEWKLLQTIRPGTDREALIFEFEGDGQQ